MACEATIIPIVLDSDSVVVDVGRARRVATREQRQALRAMYPTCGFPGCGARFGDCDIHHVTPWRPVVAPTWTTWCRCAVSTTTWSTRATGPSPCNLIARSPSPDPTAPSPTGSHDQPSLPPTQRAGGRRGRRAGGVGDGAGPLPRPPTPSPRRLTTDATHASPELVVERVTRRARLAPGSPRRRRRASPTARRAGASRRG